MRINPAYRTLDDVLRVIQRLCPPGDWAPEWLVKAGEGGTWQSEWDGHSLTLSGQEDLARLVAHGREIGLAVTPYVVVRGKREWSPAEWLQIVACSEVAERVVLNLEPGSSYWNGPIDVDTLRREYLDPLRDLLPKGAVLELCTIPRPEQVRQLGGPTAINAWLDLCQSASWECYELLDTALRPDNALAYLDGWLRPGPQWRIPVVQRSRVGWWAPTPLAAGGIQTWQIDGDQ